MNPGYDICFLSILYPENIPQYDVLTKRHRAQNITAIQKSLIEGIKADSNSQMWLINTLLVPLYGKGYQSPVVKELPLLFNGTEGINHAYWNLPIIHSSSLFYGAKKHIRKWAQEKSEKKKVLIAYSLTSYTLKAVQYAKRINPSVLGVIIVPDLPQYTYQKQDNFIANLKNSIGKRKVVSDIHRCCADVDGWVLFSEHMVEKIPRCKNSMVMESISSDLFCSIEGKRLFGEEIFEILYAGGCNKEYGMPLLVDAFQRLPMKNARLIIYGRGNYQKEIEKAAQTDKRIFFGGEISRSELLALQKSADLLVNPRVNAGVFTRYSFPSKNMEYLSSGVPMVAYKLEGIPDDYDVHINYFQEPTAESLASCWIEVYNNYPQAKAKAICAQKYVLEEKNKSSWGKKIVRFMDGL